MALTKGPLARFLLAMLALYAVVAVFTDAKDMIQVVSAMLLVLSIAVCVAYSMPAWRAVKNRPLTAAGFLALGIFLSWAGSAVLRTMNLVVYGLGRPDWLGTDAQTFGLFLNFLAGLLHLAAPELSDNGLLPSRAWILGGVLAAGAASLLLAVALLR